MKKIILNRCFGGYCWSNKGADAYLNKAGIAHSFSKYDWRTQSRTPVSREEAMEDDDVDIIIDGESFYTRGIGREHPIAIAVLEEYGSEFCSGCCSELEIFEYDDDLYIADIDDYDGSESLVLSPNITEERIRACKDIDEIVNLLRRTGAFDKAERN